MVVLVLKQLMLFLFLILKFQSKIWTAEMLSNEFKYTANYNFSITDPEFLLEDNKNYKAIIANLLPLNRIFSKININFFFIPRISEKYIDAASQSIFAKLLQEKIENNINISNKVEKTSYLNVIFVSRQKFVIIDPSEKILKILPSIDIDLLKNDLVNLISTRKYEKSILELFRRLDIIWKKYSTINHQKNSEENFEKKKDNNRILNKPLEILNNVQLIISLLFFIGILLAIYLKRKQIKNQSKNFAHIKLDKNEICLICDEKIKINKNKENLFIYEEVLFQNLDKSKCLGILNCGHVYHSLCIHHWEFEKENLGDFELNCPICMKNMLLQEKEDIMREEYPERSEIDGLSRVYQNKNLIGEPLYQISEREMTNKEQLNFFDNLLEITRESLKQRKEKITHQHSD